MKNKHESKESVSHEAKEKLREKAKSKIKTKSKKQVAYLLSKVSPLSAKEKAKLKHELHEGEVKIK